MDSVLLLNATFEPIRVLPMRRAMVLVLQGKAEVIEEGEGFMRSQREKIATPSVIRLKYYVKVPHKARVALNRRSVLTRDEYVCQYTHCDRRASTIDHVQPRSKGGKHEWTNVVACCTKCNSKKADRPYQEFGWHLRRQPKAPTANLWLVNGIKSRPEWESYLKSI